MTKQARSETTRRKIIESAAHVFERFGYAGTTLGDIVNQCGMTRGALYFHFTTKEEVARAVVDAQHARSVSPARDWLTAEGNSLKAAIRLSQGLAGQLMTDSLVRAGIRLTLEQGTFGSEFANPYVEWVSVTEELIERAMKEGDVRTTLRPAAVARFLVGAFTGVQMLSQVLSGREDLMLRVQEMWAVVLPSLVPARKLPHFLQVTQHPPRLPSEVDQPVVAT